MRSSGGTNFGLLLSVVVLTKSMIAYLAGPSFQEGRGLASAVGAAVEGAGLAGGGAFEEQEKFSPTSSRAAKISILDFRFLTVSSPSYYLIAFLTANPATAQQVPHRRNRRDPNPPKLPPQADPADERRVLLRLC
jgi:hypothetical protein